MDTFAFSIEVNGTRIWGYQSLSLSYGLESFARPGSLSLSDVWNIQDSGLPFQEGDEIKIFLLRNDRKVGTLIDGWIDSMALRYTATTNSILLEFRSKVSDLFDCSARSTSTKWKQSTLLKIAQDVIQPFGLSAEIHPSAATEASRPFVTFSIQEEETCFDLLCRAAKLRGLHVLADESNKIIFSKAGTASNRSIIRNGSSCNVASCDAMFSMTDRFSEYTVRSQHLGNRTYFGETITSKSVAVTTDDGVSRYRPLILTAEGQGLKPELERRAAWERNVRAGKSLRLSYVLNAPSNLFPDVFPINSIISVEDNKLDVDRELLICNVQIESSEKGTFTTLDLLEPSALDILIPPKKRRRGGGGGSVF